MLAVYGHMMSLARNEGITMNDGLVTANDVKATLDRTICQPGIRQSLEAGALLQ